MAHYEYEEGEPFVVIEKHSSSLGSFFWGLVAGAGLALLFAPQSGADTRYRIKLKARRAKQAAPDIAGDVPDTVGGSIGTRRRGAGAAVRPPVRRRHALPDQASGAAREAGGAGHRRGRD